jgi:hypothetical protein
MLTRAFRVLLLALPMVAAPLAAQSAQAYGVQLSALFTSITAGGTSVAGAGAEVQQRFNRAYASEGFGAVSIGLGAQYSVHSKIRDRLRIAGMFVEPRWVPPTGSETVFPYVSARLAVLRMSGSFEFAESGSALGSGFGLGGGVAVRLSQTVNLDAGAQLVRQQFGTISVLTFKPFTTYTAKIGVTIGYPR